MEAWIAVAVGIGAVGYGLVSKRTARWPLTMPMVFLVLGVLLGLFDQLSIAAEPEAIALLAEIALAVILFGDASRLDLPNLRMALGVPARLLAIGMPLSIALGTITVFMLLDLPFWEAALVAAILAPTDAALGQAVVENEDVPEPVRQSLIVESGLNDGLALPTVMLFIALSDGMAEGPGFWSTFLLQQLGLGIVIGCVVGAAGAWLLARALKADWVTGISAQLATLATGAIAVGLALALGANGFIAAFVTGLSFAAVVGRFCGDDPHIDDVGMKEAERLGEYTEDTGQLLAMLAFFVFGNVFVGEALASLTLPIVVCAVASLTIGRMLPVALSLLGTGARPATVAFLGWFGPRGLASVLFGLILFDEGFDDAQQIFNIIAVTVVLSVFAHGATAAWGARRYASWFETGSAGSMEDSDSATARPVRPRWSTSR